MTTHFDDTYFLGAFLQTETIPPFFYSKQGTPLFEIPLIGKSNVGKSSFINHVTQKKIAYISTKPGKTQTLNFITVQEKYCFVDLPGYGFAKVPKLLQKKWSTALDAYFTHRQLLQATFLLFDSRRIPAEEDLAALYFIHSLNKPCYIILTKWDKLSPQEQNIKTPEIQDWTTKHFFNNVFVIPYSIKKSSYRKNMLLHLTQISKGPLCN